MNDEVEEDGIEISDLLAIFKEQELPEMYLGMIRRAFDENSDQVI